MLIVSRGVRNLVVTATVRIVNTAFNYHRTINSSDFHEKCCSTTRTTRESLKHKCFEDSRVVRRKAPAEPVEGKALAMNKNPPMIHCKGRGSQAVERRRNYHYEK